MHVSFLTTIGRELVEAAEACGATDVVIIDGYEASAEPACKIGSLRMA